MVGMNEHRKAQTVASIDSVLQSAHRRRVALGLVDMPELDAQVRMRARDKLTTEQFMALLALPDDRREGQLRAMDAAQRHSHAVIEVRAVARSELDDRILYRWWCACGAEARGDYFSGSAACAAWEEHAGIAHHPAPSPATGERRECARVDCDRGKDGARRTFVVREDRQNQQYCCGACRDADLDRRQRPRLFGTED